MQHDYVWEKLWQALDCLVGEGTQDARLEGAGLALMLLRREQFADDDEYARWSAIMERFTAREDAADVDEESIAASVKTMSRAQVQSLIGEILVLYERHIAMLTRADIDSAD